MDMMDMNELLKMEEYSFRNNIGKGDIVRGTIIGKKNDEYYVSFGYKIDGILPENEVDEDLQLNIDDKIDLIVVKKSSDEVILSQIKAEEINTWKSLKIGNVIDVTIVDKNNSGLICKYKSIRAFIPLSHVNTRFTRDINFDDYKNKKIKAEVLDVDNRKNKLVVSLKNILMKEETQKKNTALESLNENEIYDGIIKDVKEYGLFVDINGIVGLVHKTETTWNRNEDITKVFNKGDKVKVKILSFDKEKERLSLSIKALQKNPWETFVETYEVGDIVEGKIRSIKDYGVFVTIDNLMDGFVHISNLSHEFVKSAKDIVKVGEEVKAKILSIDISKHRIELSMLGVNEEQ
jgi:ribosomal protein S1